MQSGFGRSLVVSGVSHLLVLVVFIVAPSWFAPRRSPTTTIELVNPADLLPPPVTTVAPEPPENDQAQISRTTRRTTRQTTSARPTSSSSSQETTQATTSTERTTSARRTTRATSRLTSTVARTSSRPVLDTNVLRDRLNDRLRTNTAGTTSGDGRVGVPSAANGFPGWYYDSIRAALYDAWRPPPHAQRGLSCIVEMRVARDGAIANPRVTRGSGDSEVDASALEAVRSVGKIPPLPQSIQGRYKDLSITFRVESGP